MEELIDINRYDFEFLKKLRLCIHYTRTELEFLQQQADKHLDEKIRVCTTCTSSIAEFKQQFFSWFLNNQEKIEEQLAAQEQVAEYTNNKNTPE